MTLPRWIDDELPRRGGRVLMFAAIVLLLIVGFAVLRPQAPTVAAIAPVGPPPLPAATTPTPPASPMATTAAAAPALPACPHQQADIHTGTAVQRGCLSATRTLQNGSVRTYEAVAEGVSNWQLAVDASGPRVLAVRLRRTPLGTDPERLYACEGAACAGVALDEPGPDGRRQLKLVDTPLAALAPGQRWRPAQPGVPLRRPKTVDAAAGTLRLQATLTLQPDRLSPALACADGGLRIVQGASSVVEFCALGGAGFELADDGRPRFLFRDLEGRTLVIAMAPDGSVEQVSLGALTCRAPSCGGVSVQAAGDAADPAVARRFAFSGTTLSARTPQQPGATLDGSVSMPSLQ